MNVYKMVIGCALIGSANLSALCLTSNVELSGGYRQDDFKTGENYFGINPPDGVVRSNDTTAKHINVWQIGARARLFFPDFSCCYNNYDSCCDNNYYNCGCGCFDWGFLRNFYVKAHGYWGTDAGTTRFHDDFTLLNFGSNDFIHRARSAGKGDYNTYDWQIGLGYLIDLGCLCNCQDFGLAIGVLGGYSWNKQKFKTKQADSIGAFEICDCDDGPACDDAVFVAVDDELYEGFKFNNRWQGGWLGVELYYQTCDLLFNLGYEYHWSNWRSVVTPNDFAVEEIGGYTTETRKSNKAWGNVVYLDTTYLVCDCWDIGLGFKYGYFKAHNGRVHEEEITDQDPFDGRGSWQTWQLTANVGYNW